MSRLLVLGNAGLDIGHRPPRAAAARRDPARPRRPARAGRQGAQPKPSSPPAPGWYRCCSMLRSAMTRRAARSHNRSLPEPFAELDLSIRPVPTDLSILMVLPGGENAIVTAGDCAHALTPDDAAAFTGRCDAGDWLLLQGNLRDTVTAAAIHAARARGGCILLNTAPVTAGMTALCCRCATSWSPMPARPGNWYLAGEDPVTALRAASAGIAIVTLGDRRVRGRYRSRTGAVSGPAHRHRGHDRRGRHILRRARCCPGSRAARWLPQSTPHSARRP